jgi:hypothetical protein
MTRLRVHNFAISVDGFAAGPRQSQENPLGEGGMRLRAADGRDVVLGGGPATIRQFLAAGLVDEMHMAIAPVLLGEGERLFGSPLAPISGYSCSGLTSSAGVAHARITRG